MQKRVRLEGAKAKLFTTESAFKIADQSLQIHGGIGYTKDLPVERCFRDARLMMLEEERARLFSAKYSVKRLVGLHECYWEFSR